MFYSKEKAKADEPLSEREILKLCPAASLALSVRCALRVFPFVGMDGHFSFWKKDAVHFVDVLERSILWGYLAVIRGKRGVIAQRQAWLTVESQRALHFCHSQAHHNLYSGIYAAVNTSYDIVAGYAAESTSSAEAAVNVAAGECRNRQQKHPEKWLSAVLQANREDYNFLLEQRSRGWWFRNHEGHPEAVFEHSLYPESLGLKADDFLLTACKKAFASINQEKKLEDWAKWFEGKEAA